MQERERESSEARDRKGVASKRKKRSSEARERQREGVAKPERKG
jgi:hypothetical protein